MGRWAEGTVWRWADGVEGEVEAGERQRHSEAEEHGDRLLGR